MEAGIPRARGMSARHTWTLTTQLTEFPDEFRSVRRSLRSARLPGSCRVKTLPLPFGAPLRINLVSSVHIVRIKSLESIHCLSSSFDHSCTASGRGRGSTTHRHIPLLTPSQIRRGCSKRDWPQKQVRQGDYRKRFRHRQQRARQWNQKSTLHLPVLRLHPRAEPLRPRLRPALPLLLPNRSSSKPKKKARQMIRCRLVWEESRMDEARACE